MIFKVFFNTRFVFERYTTMPTLSEGKEDITLLSEGDEVVLRCGDHGPCCPVVKILNGEVVISDDYGGSVRLTARQAVQFGELASRLP